MKLIAHRGNITGPNKDLENNPAYILNAISQGFDTEIDVWSINGSIFLGHDKPEYKVLNNFLFNSKFWCHAKNIEALKFMLENNIHCFWHQEDDYTITSKNKIWVYPNKLLVTNSICVMPEVGFQGNISDCHGICSDYIGYFTNKI